MDTALRWKRSRRRGLLTRDTGATVPLYVAGTALSGPSLGAAHIHVGQSPFAPTGSIILEQAEEVARYRLSFDHLRAQSLSADDSRRMLSRAAEDLA